MFRTQTPCLPWKYAFQVLVCPSHMLPFCKGAVHTKQRQGKILNCGSLASWMLRRWAKEMQKLHRPISKQHASSSRACCCAQILCKHKGPNESEPSCGYYIAHHSHKFLKTKCQINGSYVGCHEELESWNLKHDYKKGKRNMGCHKK